MNEWRAEKVAKKLQIDELHVQNDELKEQHDRERANETKEDVQIAVKEKESREFQAAYNAAVQAYTEILEEQRTFEARLAAKQ